MGCHLQRKNPWVTWQVSDHATGAVHALQRQMDSQMLLCQGGVSGGRVCGEDSHVLHLSHPPGPC
jgi:hypothetical protein